MRAISSAKKGSIDLNNGGGDLIEQVNEYKYLGVYFSRSLKFNYHINSYVKENADQKQHQATFAVPPQFHR
jgi:hypothetical protein